MNSEANRAILVLLAAIVVLAGLVYLFGYPLLITVAVIAAFAAIGGIVVLSAGDMLEKPSRSAESREPERRAAASVA